MEKVTAILVSAEQRSSYLMSAEKTWNSRFLGKKTKLSNGLTRPDDEHEISINGFSKRHHQTSNEYKF